MPSSLEPKKLANGATALFGVGARAKTADGDVVCIIAANRPALRRAWTRFFREDSIDMKRVHPAVVCNQSAVTKS